jgi:hypothetical protein
MKLNVDMFFVMHLKLKSITDVVYTINLPKTIKKYKYESIKVASLFIQVYNKTVSFLIVIIIIKRRNKHEP